MSMCGKGLNSLEQHQREGMDADIFAFAATQLNAMKQGNVEMVAEDAPAVRFTLRLLKWLLQGFNAKDKIVRIRVVSLVTEIIGHLDELE